MPKSSKPKIKKSDLHSIYVHIGGEAGLERILRDFYQRMADDILIGYFFTGKDLKKIANQQKSFLMRAMGAKPSYSGKAPAQAHLELPPILSGHFDRRLRILEDILRTHGVSAQDMRTWIEFENTFREKIIS